MSLFPSFIQLWRSEGYKLESVFNTLFGGEGKVFSESKSERKSLQTPKETIKENLLRFKTT